MVPMFKTVRHNPASVTETFFYLTSNNKNSQTIKTTAAERPRGKTTRNTLTLHEQLAWVDSEVS